MRLHVHEWGHGLPLVCLHGVTGHGERFRKLAQERLEQRRVLAFDLRGHGRSGYEQPWTFAQHVDDILETTSALGVERSDWLGFSMGGRILAELAHRAPERVERVILLDPALQIPRSIALEERPVGIFATPDEAIASKLAAGTLISTPREILEEDVAQHLVPTGDGRLTERYSHAAALAGWEEMASDPPPPADRPTLYVVGSESYIPNDEGVERYREALGPRLRYELVRSGHSVLWDAFEATGDAVSDFLA